MMRLLLFSTLAVSLFWIAVALADPDLPVTQAQETLPVAVQKEIAEIATMCLDLGGKPMKSPELVLVADLTGDEVPDYVIDQGAFNCEGATSLFSGSGGSQMSAYVGSPGGHAFRAFSSGSFDLKLNSQRRTAKLYLAVAGPMCGQRVTPKISRSEHKSCWRPVNWNAKNRKMEFAPVSQVTRYRP
jgi:hypothetical protein